MRTSKAVLERVLFLVLFIALSYPAMSQLKADFTTSPQSGCAPLIVTFSDASKGAPASWKWDLGNGVTSAEQNPTSSYFDPGVYTVKLVIYKDDKSDSIVKTNHITVYKNPVVSFKVSDSTGCFPLNISYTDKSNPGSGVINKYTWDFGDGNISSQAQPSHSYLEAGTFSVTLSVTNSVGCSATGVRQNLVHVGNGVKASYTATPGAICHSPAPYNFSSTSTGEGTLLYKWIFGDGGVATQSQTTHNYTKEGSYSVTLKVTSPAGCSDSITKPLAISFVKPVISIADTICPGNTVQFVNASTPVPASASWNFGDGATSNEVSPYKIYTQPGTYKVKAVNTFFAGCVDSVTKNITVIPAATPSFTVQDSAGCSLPYTAHFTNTSSSVGSVTYTWDFGDGTTATGTNPVHEYTKYGNFTVTLKATNAGGCSQAISKTNAVALQPIKITGVTGLASGCVPFVVKPVVKTNIPAVITKYTWNFGDGTISNDVSPTHTYAVEGIYTVKVKIETAGGCSDSLILSDSAGHHLAPQFTVNPVSVCAKDEIAFLNTTPGGTFTWTLGDGTTIYKMSNPRHNYHDTGFFDVTLVVYNNGCYDTITKNKVVHIAGPVAKFNTQNNCTNKLQLTLANKSIDDRTRRWDFGDGKTDTAKNPVHIYNNPGSYHVQLYVSNGTCDFTADTTVKIVNEKGIFSITDSIVCRGVNAAYSLINVNPKNISSTLWNLTGSQSRGSGDAYTIYAYTAPGKYSPSVIVTDVLGCKDTLKATHNVTVYGPSARFTAVNPGGCQNTTVYFKDTSVTDGTHPITSWTFDFGDSNKATYTAKGIFQNTYANKGLYTVTMAVKDSYGCTDTNRQVNLVQITRPVAAFSLTDSLICPGSNAGFKNKSDGVSLKYNWDLGDGRQVAAVEPTNINYQQGMYTIKLVATDVNGCKDSAILNQALRVFTPSAAFLMSDSISNCPPLTVNFTNQSTNYAAFGWNFGDGNTSNVVVPAHIYTYPGVYPVKLIVSGIGGCADTAVKKITIKGPTGTLTYKANNVCYPHAQQFKAVSQNAVQYLWDYSDGNTQLTSSDTSSHVYAPGAYLPKMILIDKDGCKVPIRGVDTLNIFTIKAKASADSYLLCDSGKITFNDSSITNDVVKIHKWIFDGETVYSAGPSATHYYKSSGTYSVTLVDVTANGCKDSVKIAAPIKVVKSFVVSVKGTTSYCAPASLALQGDISLPDTSDVKWSWDFGNGVNASGQTPEGIVLPNAGQYPVKVTVSGGSGCAGSGSAIVTVHSAPNVKAGADTTICRNSNINLQATGATEYTWRPVAGISCTSCSNPVVTSDTTALYSVTGKNEYGCTATDSVTVKVIQPVHVSLSKGDTLCNGESKQLVASGAHSYQWSPALFLSDAATAQPTFNAVKDTTMAYLVVGTDEKSCFKDTASIKVKVYPIPQMQVKQSAITASAGGEIKLETISSPDVTKWKWSPAIWLSNPSAASPVAQPRESITYTVVAANDGACITRAQIAVTVVCNGSNIFVPNTFSPNGDGVNEKFYPQGTGLYNIKSFRVFNRWGQLVFEKLNIAANNPADGWDGTFKGQKLMPDVFVYIIEVMCVNNTIVPVKGNITLIR